jgi:hypothetical protein
MKNFGVRTNREQEGCKMSIVQSRDDYYPDSDKCSLCGEKAWIPFFWYRGKKPDATTDIVICSQCCSYNARGIILDLLQLETSYFMNRIGGYSLALERTTPRANPGDGAIAFRKFKKEHEEK